VHGRGRRSNTNLHAKRAAGFGQLRRAPHGQLMAAGQLTSQLLNQYTDNLKRYLVQLSGRARHRPFIEI